MSFRFERSARTPTAVLSLGAIWALVLVMWLVLGAAPLILAGLLALTLPAAWDFATNRPAGLEIGDTHLRWWSGRHRGDARLAVIDHVRLERRLDLSMRARLVLPDKRRVSLPQDSLPPADALEQALRDAGLRVERHPFSLL